MKKLGSLSFVGMGLHDERGMSLRGLEEAKAADIVLLELYTSRMPGLSLEKLERLIGKRVVTLSRQDLEENAPETLGKLKSKRTVLLVPGDPLISTTHVSFRIEAERQGVRTRVIHAASIVSAIAGVTGLQSGKFGRTITIPVRRDGEPPESPYNWLKDNLNRGLHTLALLEIDSSQKRHVTVPDALSQLLQIAKQTASRALTQESLAVVVARVEAEDCQVKADRISRIMQLDFGEPPHSIVFPSKLHFLEAKALEVFANAPSDALEAYK